MIGWSGDAVQLQEDNPNLEWRMPTEGCMLWSEDMVIPIGAPNPTAAEAFMNYVYKPEVQANIAEYVNYVTPVEGVKQVLAKREPKLAKNQLIFPERLLHQEVLGDAGPGRRRGTEGDQSLRRGAERLIQMRGGCTAAAGARGMSALRRRLVPYFLLGPGTIWLVLFFVVPLFYMAELSLGRG